MKLLVVSDLHIEHGAPWRMPEDLPAFDVAVFPGDVGQSPSQAIEWMNEQRWLDGKEIVYVCGNHEFYGGVIEDRVAEGRRFAAAFGVTLLDADEAVVRGVRFLGCTLWTDYALDGDAAEGMAVALTGLNDHYRIGTLGDGAPGDRPQLFMPMHARARHLRERAWLAARLAEPFDGPTVVVTHHCPHPGSVAPKYQGSLFNAAFASDLTALIETGGADLWVHGHTHDSYDYVVGRTRIVCNPKGYGPSRTEGPIENAAFDPRLVIEIPARADPGRVSATTPR